MKMIFDEVMKPISRRIGSLLAGALIAHGVDAGLTDQIVIGALALLGVASDLIWSKVARAK